MVRFVPSLKACLAQHGFTSSENYDYAVQCFLTNPVEHLRCLHIDGDCGRRRTAFAHAFAHSLHAEQVIYHEFGVEKPIPRVIRIQEGDEVVEEPPVDALDRVMTEACAQSEATQTVLILDQLHKTPFLNHIRLYDFLQNGLWRYSDVQFQANKHNLKVFLISNEGLYHSLQTLFFRLWINAANRSRVDVTAEDLGLDVQNAHEFQRMTYDISQHVLNQQQLKLSLFGWLENVDKSMLDDQKLQAYFDQVIKAVLSSKNVAEEIEISSVSTVPPEKL